MANRVDRCYYGRSTELTFVNPTIPTQTFQPILFQPSHATEGENEKTPIFRSKGLTPLRDAVEDSCRMMV